MLFHKIDYSYSHQPEAALWLLQHGADVHAVTEEGEVTFFPFLDR
jgi:hypothetical protein